MTASAHNNIFTFEEDAQAISLEIKEQEIEESMIKLTKLKDKDMSDVSAFNEFVELFEFYEKTQFNIQLKEAKRFCTMFTVFSQEYKNELLENDQFDAEKRNKIIYLLNGIEETLRVEAKKNT